MNKVERSMKKLTALLLTALLVLGSTQAIAQEEEISTAEIAAEEDTAEELLREDYYEYVNHDLLASVEISPTEAEWNQFSDLSYEVIFQLSDDLDEMLENRDQAEKGSIEQKIADYYLSFLDEDSRNSAGLGQLQQYVDAFLNAGTVQEYIDEAGVFFNDFGVNSILGIGVTIDIMDSTQYVAVLNEMSFGLGKEILEEEAFADIMPDYEAYIALLLEEAGYGDEAESYASEVFAFLNEMASYDLSSEEMSMEDIYNLYTSEELDELFFNVDMNSYLTAAGMDGWDSYLVFDPDFSEEINDRLTEDNLELLKAYTVFIILDTFSTYLPMDIYQAKLDFTMELYGIQEQDSAETMAAEVTQAMFPWEFAQIYVENNFSEEEKEEVTEMVEEFIDHYRERIYELDWMEDETKDAAVKKLDTMAIQIGYPDEWPSYNEDAEILGPEDGGNCIDNSLALLNAAHQYAMEIDSGEVNRNLWVQLPTEVNACYEASSNSLFFPAAILQAPFYDPDATKAQNYGAIGMVIAHEITHAFDSTGSLYDENGNYNPWWSEADAEKFDELTQEVVDYYNTFTIDGLQVNGEQTLDENIADLGSVNTITSFFEDDTEQLDELFRSIANIYAAKYTDEVLINDIDTDEHAPDPVRVNATIRTLDCFYETYPEIQEGDPMYLAPEDRVRIW